MQGEAVGIAAGLCVDAAGGESPGLCLFDAGWHQGVVGLVAGRIKDRLHRPVIAFARAEDGSLRGSARSVPGVNIRDALDGIAVRNPGPHREIRRPCDGGGDDAGGGGSRPVSRARSPRRSPRARTLSALRGVVAFGRRVAGRASCRLRPRVRCAARAPGARDFPSRYSTGHSRCSKRGSWRAGTSRCGSSPAGAAARRGIDAIAFGHAGGDALDPAVRPGRRLQVAYRLEVNDYRGAESMQLNCQHILPA